MATSKKDDKPDTSASDAAVAEATSDETGMATVEFGGHEYTFKRSVGNSPQFRLFFQQGRDVAGVGFLIGNEQLQQFFDRTADADGVTPDDVFQQFCDAINSGLNAGN